MKHATIDRQFATSATPAKPLKSSYLKALKLSLVDATPQTAIAALLSPGKRRVYFMNAHCCNIMAKVPAYAHAVRYADALLPDGIGIKLAGKMSGQKLTANLNGTDLIPALLVEAANSGKSVFLFGGTPGTAKAAAKTLTQMIPHLKVAGTRNGFEGAADTEEVIDEINTSGADIVLVALGVPMQELWLHRNAARLNADLTICVGAALDFLAGNVSRAPKLLRAAQMEWIWRLAIEPRRMVARYLKGNVEFLARAAMTLVRTIAPKEVIHRAIDVAIAGFGLVVLAPLLAAVAVAIKLDSAGPVLFRQTRIGKNGQNFPMLKFRSMFCDAEAQRAKVQKNATRKGICFKAANDPRITCVGRFIRRFSIDELPQIINVLRGEMSIVGPRPALPCEVAIYPSRAHGRLAVKPGITGIWQVSGRADVSFEHMIDMDLTYARNRTVLLDLIVVMLTFRAVLSGRGAY